MSKLPTANEMAEAIKKMGNPRAHSKSNNWHERGERPPVGEVIQYSCLRKDGKESIELGSWYQGRIIAYHDGFVWTSDNGLRMISNTKFRPIRTERDKLIDRAINSASLANAECDSTFAGALIDAGWRPTKKQSEDEFVSECLKFIEAKKNAPFEMARYIYQAGCRFIEEEK